MGIFLAFLCAFLIIVAILFLVTMSMDDETKWTLRGGGGFLILFVMGAGCGTMYENMAKDTWETYKTESIEKIKTTYIASENRTVFFVDNKPMIVESMFGRSGTPNMVILRIHATATWHDLEGPSTIRYKIEGTVEDPK